MIDPHLSSDLLGRFADDDLTDHDALEVLWHLFTCESCRRRSGQPVSECAGRLFEDDRSITSNTYREIVERAIQAAQALNRAQSAIAAPDRAESLLRQSKQRQTLLIRNHRGFADLGLAEQLLKECRSSWSDSPAGAERIAHLALEIAEQIAIHQTAHPALINDLRARAWSYVANCLRIQAKVRDAEPAFRKAHHWIEMGTGDILETASLYELESSYFRDTQRFAEASSRLDAAIDLYRAANDPHLEGRTLINRAILAREIHRPDHAISLLEQAAAKLDFRREPALAFVLKQSFVALFADTGRLEEAAAVLPEARRMAELYGGRLDRLRLVWAEGVIANQMGEQNEAIITLECVRDAFIEEGIGYDAALVALDLAKLHLEAGRTSDVRNIAQEILPIFASRDVHREAIAALTLLRQALLQDRATTDLVDRLATYLRQARHQPTLQFQDGA